MDQAKLIKFTWFIVDSSIVMSGPQEVTIRLVVALQIQEISN